MKKTKKFKENRPENYHVHDKRPPTSAKVGFRPQGQAETCVSSQKPLSAWRPLAYH